MDGSRDGHGARTSWTADIKGAIHLVGAWILQAGRDLVAHLHRLNWWTSLVVPALLAVIAAAYGSFYTGVFHLRQHPKPVDMNTIIPGLVVLGGYFILIGLVNLLLAPYRHLRHERTKHEDALTNAQTDHATKLARLTREHSDAISRAESERDAAKVELATVTSQRDQLMVQPVTDSHAQQLRQLVEPMRSQWVPNGKRCGINNGVLREAFERHFPTVWQRIEQWNQAVDACDQVITDFIARLETELDAAGIARPQFERDVVRDLLSTFTIERARRRQAPDSPFSFNWQGWTSPDQFVGEIHAGTNGPCVMRVHDLENHRDETFQALHRIEDVFSAAQSWPETLAISDRDRFWLPLRDPLDRDLEIIQQSHVITGRCALCGG